MLSPFWSYISEAHSRIFWLYMISSLLIAVLYIVLHPNEKSRLFSKSIWWHASARLDYRYFVVVALIKSFLIVPLLFSAGDIAFATIKLLQAGFGYLQPFQWDRTAVVTAYTLLLFTASDLSRYWLHRMMHTVPFLWRIHKVHHSAEVLTPVTFYRVHPIENMLFGLRYALVAGVVSGLFIYLFGAALGLWQILGSNALVFLFSVAAANLRHSHIPLRFGLAEQFVISPYMHQLHHTKAGQNCNYGGVLSLWDRMFGTVNRSETKELIFGLGRECHHTVMQLLTAPFKQQKKSITE